MPADWAVIATRLALYADLGLLFGVPLFGLYALRGEERANLFPFRTLIAALAAVGAVLSGTGFMLAAAAMAGTSLGSVDPSLLAMLLSETNVGWAFAAREAALVLALMGAIVLARKPLPLLLVASASGAVAVGTLAWSGHAAATEGSAGTAHLVADIIHMLAASAWLGALAMLIALIMPRGEASPERLQMTHRALAGFGVAGTAIVGLILLSGLVNGLFLVGPGNILSLGGSLYGQLLLVKLGLFGIMLVLAGSNRFRLTPALEVALAEEDPAGAVSALRYSLGIEIGLALTIMALVAWLGTLAPPMSGG